MDYEKDGHIYCLTCLERVDSEPMKFGNNDNFIRRLSCKCVRDERAKREEQKKLQKQSILKRDCFIDGKQMTYTFENIGKYEYEKVVRNAKKHVEHFDERFEDNIGLLLYGSVGSGKTYLACAIANEIISKYSYTVRNLKR